jgi:hypothetical protein
MAREVNHAIVIVVGVTARTANFVDKIEVSLSIQNLDRRAEPRPRIAGRM